MGRNALLSKLKKLSHSWQYYARKKEHEKSSVRCKVEHVFAIVKSACRKQHLGNDYWGYVWTVGFTAIKPKGQRQMIDAMYNYRLGEIHSAEFSDEFNKLCIPFEDSLSEEQIDVFHKILDCVSETAAAEMRTTYKVGFKDGATMMQEIQD